MSENVMSLFAAVLIGSCQVVNVPQPQTPYNASKAGVSINGTHAGVMRARDAEMPE